MALFSFLQGSKEPIRVVDKEDTAGEGLIYPTQFATLLAESDRIRKEAHAVVAQEPRQTE
jgi:hypothetical protein